MNHDKYKTIFNNSNLKIRTLIINYNTMEIQKFKKTKKNQIKIKRIHKKVSLDFELKKIKLFFVQKNFKKVGKMKINKKTFLMKIHSSIKFNKLEILEIQKEIKKNSYQLKKILVD